MHIITHRIHWLLIDVNSLQLASTSHEMWNDHLRWVLLTCQIELTVYFKQFLVAQ